MSPKDDRQQYLKGGRCREKDCTNRQRRVCKYWLDEGCTGKTDCQYLHRDMGEEDFILSCLSSISSDWKVIKKERKLQKSKKNQRQKRIIV